jgi:hypothetical protein
LRTGVSRNGMHINTRVTWLYLARVPSLTLSCSVSNVAASVVLLFSFGSCIYVCM